MTTKPDDRNGVSSPDNIPHDLVERLRRLPEVDPPEGLSARIMGALKPRRRPWWQTMLFRLSRPRSITFTPLKWAPVGAALVLGLMIGFSFNKMPAGPAPSSGPQVAQLAGDAETHYMWGRQLLADNRAQKALVHLKRAADTQPEQALYQFWLGVTYWTLKDFDREQAHYQLALQRNPDFLPAHVYIGHNYLDRGDYQAARQHYRHVLQAVPDHADALFNTGVALHRLGDIMQENEAWRAYLQHYDRGRPALQAVASLNANGDFSYRRIRLGPLSLVKPSITFDDGRKRLDASSQAALDDIGRVLAHNYKLELHILAYTANDAGAAKTQAKTIKRYLLDQYRGISAKRIKPSWFGVSEKVQLENRSYALESSIRLFATAVDES
jgi:tetratricopeptide (TPR) repeat protein